MAVSHTKTQAFSRQFGNASGSPTGKVLTLGDIVRASTSSVSSACLERPHSYLNLGGTNDLANTHQQI